MIDVNQSKTDSSISVIIPVLQGDDSWHALLADLTAFPASTEILCVSNGEAPVEFQEMVDTLGLNHRSHWLCTTRGRGIQMNHGAQIAESEFLLFLHADSRLSESAIQCLVKSLELYPNALLYFDLKFCDQSFALMQLNTWGVYFRSHILGIPFGDQGFCLSRTLFQDLKGFDETAAYGEDHLLVWTARRKGIRLRSTGAVIETSARKYQERGWMNVTFTHLWLTFRQALPQFLLLMKDRITKCCQCKAPSPSS